VKAKQNISLKQYNTFSVDARAKSFFEIGFAEELISFLKKDRFADPVLILGGGSNILFTKDFEGTVVKVGILGIKEIRKDDEYVWLKVNAGEEWDDLVNYCVQKGYCGIENLSLIPGSVGAAPIQNIGAYGVEVKDVFVELEAVNINNGETRILNAEECQFGYRDSAFKKHLKNQFLITSITIKLAKSPQFNIEYGHIKGELEYLNMEPGLSSIRQAIINIRKRFLPDPSEYGNAGSFFKNPIVSDAQYQELLSSFPDLRAFSMPDGTIKLAAGWMIDQCGMRGFQYKHAGVYTSHALILVNYGDATGKQILRLAEMVKHFVYEKFSVELEYEVNII